MPKKKGSIEERYNLKSYFAKYGVGDASPESDLRQIDEQTGLSLSMLNLREQRLRIEQSYAASLFA